MVCLVTGASRGIGRAIAQQFLKDGHRVIGTSKTMQNLFEAPNLTWRYLDLDRPSEVEDFCLSFGSEFSIDVLVNNAGINIIESFQEISTESLGEILQVNLSSALLIMKSAASFMADRKCGSIVNISSIWSEIGKPGRLGYSASKAGLVGATRVLALEMAPYGVTVNAVSPGFTDTELTRFTLSQAELDLLASKIPAGRLALPEEIAEVVSFLASEKNTYLTGQNVIVDGGFTVASGL